MGRDGVDNGEDGWECMSGGRWGRLQGREAWVLRTTSGLNGWVDGMRYWDGRVAGVSGRVLRAALRGRVDGLSEQPVDCRWCTSCN